MNEFYTPMREAVITDSSGGGAETPPTAGTAGTPAPTAPATTTAPASTAAPAQAPAKPAERTFTQADVNAMMAERAARAERAAEARYQDQLRQAQQQWQAEQRKKEPQNGEYRTPPNPIREALTPIERELNVIKLDRMLDQFSARYKDFGPNQNDIMRVALRIGTQDLDVAYRYWKHDQQAAAPAPLDEAALYAKYGAAWAQRYLAEKGATQAAAPRPEGRGGSGTPQAGKKIRTFEDADHAARDRLKRREEHGG